MLTELNNHLKHAVILITCYTNSSLDVLGALQTSSHIGLLSPQTHLKYLYLPSPGPILSTFKESWLFSFTSNPLIISRSSVCTYLLKTLPLSARRRRRQRLCNTAHCTPVKRSLVGIMVIVLGLCFWIFLCGYQMHWAPRCAGRIGAPVIRDCCFFFSFLGVSSTVPHNFSSVQFIIVSFVIGEESGWMDESGMTEVGRMSGIRRWRHSSGNKKSKKKNGLDCKQDQLPGKKKKSRKKTRNHVNISSAKKKILPS